jgi:hypothetical protein
LAAAAISALYPALFAVILVFIVLLATVFNLLDDAAYNWEQV